MKTNFNQLKGYKLHQKRVYFTGGEITRTIKVPIDENSLNEDQKKYLLEIKNQIIDDDLKTRGDINLNDYLNFSYKNNPCYNLIDFWVDSVKAGVIWQEKGNLLVNFINNKILKKDIVDLILEETSDDFKEIFDITNKELKEFITKNEVRTTSTKNSFKNKLINFLKKDYIKKEKENNKEIIKIKYDKAEKIINEIVDVFFKDEKLILIGSTKQNEFWRKRFNIDKSKFELYKPQGKLKDLTFMIIPQLVKINDNLNLEDLLEIRINHFNLNDEELNGIIGLDNNFSALSNYFGRVFELLCKEKIDEIYHALSTINPEIKNYKEIVYTSLNYLKDKAKLLGESPKLKLINSWADLRMLVGGKIQSWFSNYLRRKNELGKQTKELFTNLEKIRNLLINKNLQYKKEPENYEIENIINSIEKIKNFERQNLANKNIYEIFDFLLAELKRDLNIFYQKYLVDEKENKPIVEYENFKGIYKKIYRPMSFFGEAKRANNEKNSRFTILIILFGIETVRENLKKLKFDFLPENFIDNKKIHPDSFIKNYLNFYFNKLKNNSFNSYIFKNFFIEKISSLTKENFYDLLKNKNLNAYTFNKSPYSTSTQKIIELKEGDFIQSYKDIINQSIDFLEKFSHDELLKDKLLLTDWVEVAKNISSQLIRYSTKEVFELSLFDKTKKIYKKIDNYINLFKLEKLTKFDLKKIWQSLFLSELKGAVTLNSKETYLAKYLSQFIGSDKKINLYIFSKNQELLKNLDLDKYDEKQRKELITSIRYYLDLGLVKENKKIRNQDDVCLIKIKKDGLEKVYLSQSDFSKLYRLTTSGYQFQFLDKLIYKPKDWQEIDINLSEWSLILEKYYRINWLIDQKIPEFTYIEDSPKNKLYLSIPIKLSSKPLVVNYKLIREKTTNQPILGIDVGEYGLGFCLIKIENNQIKILNKGFIEDKNIAKIKDQYEKIQQKSRQGIFNETDTTVSRVRENAIGRLRNKVHKYVINYISTPIYEGSITNFETGSGKTVKIYNSVKRADVYTNDNSDADDKLRKSIWGKDRIAVGKNVSAYGSSQTCLKCHRSLYQLADLKENEYKKIKLINREGNILTFTYNDYKINGFYEKKQTFINIGECLRNGDDYKKFFIPSLKKFSRPPITNSEVIEKFAPESLKKDQEKLEKFKKARGNSAIFICPFVDCHFVADADIQAALIMAIRGYIKMNFDIDKKNKTDESDNIDYFNKTIELLNQFKLSENNVDDLFFPLV